MSEQAPILEKREAKLPAPEREELLTAHAEAVLNAEKGPKQLDIEAVKQNVEAAVESKSENPFEELQNAERAARLPTAPLTINPELKANALNNELRHIRRQLPKPERALSKVIHQPVVRAVSEGASKTVTRPSGLLGGGIVAFIGTSSYVYFTHHIGVTYNYLLFVLFFVGGFILGLLLEFGLWARTSRHKAK
jgi:hypothetical protein